MRKEGKREKNEEEKEKQQNNKGENADFRKNLEGKKGERMSAFSATEQDESSQLKSGKSGVTTGTAGKKRRSFWSWMRSRPTYMSFATFFMLFCGGLLTSGLGPALPIIEHQCNTFAIYIPTQPNTHLSSLFFGATAPQVGPATSSLDVTSDILQGLVRAFLFYMLWILLAATLSNTQT